MSPLASLAAAPVLVLAACGDAPAAEGTAQSSAISRTRMVNGLSMPDGLHRVYECDVVLNSPVNDAFRMRVGDEPLSILLIRTERDGNTFWAARGHLDKTVHRAADPPFPASARTELGRMILEWNIHSSRVVASLQWQSPTQDRAEVALDVTDPSGTGHREMFPYRMRAECVENSQHPLATPPKGNAA